MGDVLLNRRGLLAAGGAIVALGTGQAAPLVFVAAMIGGMLLANALRRVPFRRQAPA